jgi:uncharacterized membrane protein YhaH (DUF805 family)
MAEDSFGRRMIAPLGRLLDFGGRSTRAEHWPYMGLLIAIFAIGMVLLFPAGSVRAVLTWGYSLLIAVVLFASASVVRRLHDVGWSGRWMAAYVVMLIAFVAFYFYWRYGVVHQPYGANPTSRLLFRIWPLLMIANFAMTAIGFLIFVLTVLESQASDNKYGPRP